VRVLGDTTHACTRLPGPVRTVIFPDVRQTPGGRPGCSPGRV